jgi:hypothetical protein
VTVVDPVQHRVIKTSLLPADLAAHGGGPHDVFVDGRRRERRLFVIHSGPAANRVTVFPLAGTGFGAATS